MATDGLQAAEVLYVSADGEAVTTSLGQLDGDRVVHGLPVRRIPSFAGQGHYPDLADAARHVASQAPPAPGLTRVERSSEASLRAKLDTLTQRNKELRQENSNLRRRLEIADGQLRSSTIPGGGEDG